jgi:amidophosphoribosyltransferase
MPFRHGLIRNHYVGRTFIEPSQAIRDFGVKLKLNPVRHLLEGKRVILVDDSWSREHVAQNRPHGAGRGRARSAHAYLPARPRFHRASMGWIRPAWVN